MRAWGRRLFLSVLVFIILWGVMGLALEPPTMQAFSAGPEVIGENGSVAVPVPEEEGLIIPNGDPPAVIGLLLSPDMQAEGWVALADVAAAFGGSVHRDEQTGWFTAELPHDTLAVRAGQRVAYLDGSEYVLSAGPSAAETGLCLKAQDIAAVIGYELYLEGDEAVLVPPAVTGGCLTWGEARTFGEGPAWYLVGLVRNEGEWATELTRVAWEAGDTSGTVLARAANYINFINPGDGKVFKLVLPLRTDVTWYRVELSSGFPARPRPLALAASARRYDDRPAAYLSLLGEVTNQGEETCDFLKIMVEFLDRSGRLVDVDTAFITCLAPGQSKTFTVYTPWLEQVAGWQISFD